jgi:hypothetical protein
VKRLWKQLAALALLGSATPALADAVTDQIDRGIYWVELANSSLELAYKVTARKEKCQWARQSHRELSEGLNYYEGAERLAQNTPGWPHEQRAKLSALVQSTRDQLGKAQGLIRDLC